MKMDYKYLGDLTILSKEAIIHEYNLLCESHKEQKNLENQLLQQNHDIQRSKSSAKIMFV